MATTPTHPPLRCSELATWLMAVEVVHELHEPPVADSATKGAMVSSARGQKEILSTPR